MRYHVTVVLACLTAALVRAQTLTATNALGQTIIEVVTVNPIAGVATTQTFANNTTGRQPGPSRAAGATQTGQTTFQYTTTDAEGDTTVIQATFTPSFNTIVVSPSQTFTGTVLGYSQWLSLVGTNTVAADSASSGGPKLHHVSRTLSVGAALLAGAMGGAWLVIG
ncbi:hypothetical protein DFH11DRAFT_1545630 [Phellopilus nigrolimitatus]|nr:hypothetical protein DFH11DRAFT_1545630 [Phellopilus nigrolimitatus]